MEKQIITFSANEQVLTRTGGESRYSSNKISYIEARFDLGTNWSGFDSVRAVWSSDFARGIVTVLDADGTCVVPSEVLQRKCKVNVNLVGSIVENDVLTDRLTSYPVTAFVVDANAKVDGTETAEVTPSQFEQYVAQVQSLVATVKDIDSVVLNADYTLTINFSDGTSTTTTSIRGEQGEQGETGPTGPAGADGFSPIVTVTEITGGHEVSIEDATQTQTFDVMDGVTPVIPWDSILPVDTASGAIASFPDGTALVPAKSLKVTLEPIQDLNGYDKPWSGGNGKNKASVNEVTGVGWADNNAKLLASFNSLPVGTYTVSFDVKVTSATKTGAWQDGIVVINPNGNITRYNAFSADPTVGFTDTVTFTFTLDASQVGAFTSCYVYGCGSNGQGKMGEATLSNIQIESGSSKTSFAPYSNICPISGRTEVETVVSPTTSAEDGTTYTTALGRTVYGGTLDVVSGVLTVTDANIASYNGETLPSTWISDRDEYASGTTPTTGAQVVYKLATPQTYQLTPQQVDLLTGTNNVWSDGDVEVTYNADIQRYIEKKLG